MPAYLEKAIIEELPSDLKLITNSREFDEVIDAIGLTDDEDIEGMGGLMVKLDSIGFPEEVWGFFGSVPYNHKGCWCLFSITEEFVK